MSARIKPPRCAAASREESEADPDGRIVVHHRTVDTPREDAARRHDHAGDARRRTDFQASFIIAKLDPLRALPILRVPGTRARA